MQNKRKTFERERESEREREKLTFFKKEVYIKNTKVTINFFAGIFYSFYL